MDNEAVYLVPIGSGRFDLYTEQAEEAEPIGAREPAGFWSRAIERLHELARAGEEVAPFEQALLAVLVERLDGDALRPLQDVHDGEAHFQMEAGEGQPSRWNTLRAMRVLDWSAQAR